MKADEIFDHYDDVIDLDLKTDMVQSGTPVKTCVYNRLCYVIKNQKQLSTRKVMILPYLHERRIYLNKRHEANHFYTIHEHDGLKFILCMSVNDNKIYVYTETGILCDEIVYDDIAIRVGKPESCSENGENFLFRKSNQSFDFHLLKIGVNGMTVKSSFDIRKNIQSYLNEY